MSYQLAAWGPGKSDGRHMTRLMGQEAASEKLLTATQAQRGPDLQTVKTILKSGLSCETFINFSF